MPRPTAAPPISNLAVRIHPDLHHELRLLAVTERRSINDVVRDALTDYLRRRSPKNGRGR